MRIPWRPRICPGQSATRNHPEDTAFSVVEWSENVLIESLKVFCDLVETQSFSKTAVLNTVTQSAVSQQLKSIEKRNGRQLLEREKRRLTLTAEGEIFYQYARDIVRRYEGMQHRIQALGGVVSGTVRLSAIYSVGMLELAPYIKDYIKKFPKVNLRLEYGQALKIYDDVSSGEIDLGIVAYPRSQRNVDVVTFAEDQMVVICHPANPLADRAVVDPGALNGQPLILFASETPTRRALDRFFRKHSVRPNVVMELDHIATLLHAVEVDIGISIVPANTVAHLNSRDSLKVITFDGESLTRPLGILHRKGRSFSIATQKLLEVLTEDKHGPGAEDSPGNQSVNEA